LFIPVPEDSVRAHVVLTGEYHAPDSFHPDHLTSLPEVQRPGPHRKAVLFLRRAF
jgi:hypothetical protein